MRTVINREEQNKALSMCVEILYGYGVSVNVEKVISDSRKADVVFHRALICFILKTKKYALGKIGSIINRDHSTVLNLLHYRNRVQAGDPRFHTITKNIKGLLVTKNIQQQIDFHRRQIAGLKKLLKKHS